MKDAASRSLGLLVQTSRTTRAASRALAPYRLEVDEVNVLTTVYTQPHITALRLAQELLLIRETVHLVLARLRDRALIDRNGDELELTQAGEALLEAAGLVLGQTLYQEASAEIRAS